MRWDKINLKTEPLTSVTQAHPGVGKLHFTADLQSLLSGTQKEALAKTQEQNLPVVHMPGFPPHGVKTQQRGVPRISEVFLCIATEI